MKFNANFVNLRPGWYHDLGFFHHHSYVICVHFNARQEKSNLSCLVREKDLYSLWSNLVVWWVVFWSDCLIIHFAY